MAEIQGSVPIGGNILLLDFFFVVNLLMPILSFLTISFNLLEIRIRLTAYCLEQTIMFS